MDNRNKQTADTISYRNTLDCYFKTINAQNVQLAKASAIDYKYEDPVNANTNSTYANIDISGNYDQENDNSNQNCVSFSQLQRAKNKAIEMADDDEGSANSHTMVKVQHTKIKLSTLDDEQTRKFSKVISEAIKNEIKKQNALEDTQKNPQEQKGRKNNKVNPFDNYIDLGLQNKVDSKVEQILRKQSLRSKFVHLLKDDQKYSIGHQHNKLLKLLRTIDTTIDFIKSNRRIKSIFFGDIQKHLKEINRQDVSQNQLQQLLFLDDTLFTLEWALSDRAKGYDLLLHSPIIHSEDERISAIRKRLVNFLIEKEFEFLSNNSFSKDNNTLWVDGFDPNNVELPIFPLPLHPHLKHDEIICIPNNIIQAVPNPHLRHLTKQENSDAQSLKSKDVASMIFGKYTSKDIEEKLYNAIKQKSEKITKMNLAEAYTKVSKTDLKNIVDEIMIAYMGKGVSNIFKQTLIEILNNKLRIKLPLIIEGLRIILQDHKDIGFLKQVATSNGTFVLQVNRTKFSSLMQVVKEYE